MSKSFDIDKTVRLELVRCLWFGCHFSNGELRTREGDTVEVYSPGWWNVDEGPSFLRAEMRIGDKEYVKENSVSVECYRFTSEVGKEVEELDVDVVVVLEDDKPDCQIDRPVLCLGEVIGDDVLDLFS